MLVSLSEYQSLPAKPGIYFFLDEKGKILYIGKAKNLKRRVNSYFAKYTPLGVKTQSLVSKINKIKTIVVASEIEAFLLENRYIKKYKPKYNVKLTDDKGYPLIRITADKYPKVLIVRKTQDKNSIYFGPYPNASQALRLTLKTIRKIFPYQSVLNHQKKICLYYHLGLCRCPPVFDSLGLEKEYRKTVKHIINFLNGNTKKVINDLRKERDLLSRNEEFEKARIIQRKIQAMELITKPFYKTSLDLNINPNFTEDLREKEIYDLLIALKQNKMQIKSLKRIECFDISNTSGTNPTGSMVVFTDGEKNTSQYRRFKIKYVQSAPDDFAMIREVIERRLNHKEWLFPDLIIVDGGKGQISSAIKAVKSKNLEIPVIGLAKKEETIITQAFNEIILPKTSNALKLVMRIRDEAHRFAITYHRQLRSKKFLN